MSERTVNCVKLEKTAKALDKAPFSGELGEEIYNKVSEEAWLMWKDDMMIKVINEYRLNLADPDNYDVLLKQLRLFLKLEAGESLEVENADRGKEPA